jgi:outer membrane immunogenic protein
VEDVMKKTILLATVVAMAVASGAALAADLPRSPAPYYNPAPSSLYNWSGFYAGLNLGYGWGKVTNTGINPSGILGGGQVGYNWQSGQFVFGAETDLQASGASDTFTAFKFSNPWFGTLRGRAGYAFNNFLVYGTLGLAYGDLRGEFGGAVETHTMAGWAGGIGAEYGFAPNWSAKVEYLYMDLADRGFAVTGMDNGYRANILRLGVNYHF